MHPMRWLGLVMGYIDWEYDNIPEVLTSEMEEYLRESYNRQESIPNAAGGFAEAFLKAKTCDDG